MTLPASGPLTLGLIGGGNSINGEFGYGNNLQSYLGVYYGLGGQEFQFPHPGNSIAMQLFYNTYKISGGSQTFNASQSFTIPVYNTITITVQGGQGGQAGQFGYRYCNCSSNCFTPSGGGGTGNVSSFGGYVSAAGGGGGGGDGNTGSPGQIATQTFTNPLQGGSGPPSGSSLTVSVGSGGSGGGGGQIWTTLPYFGCGPWSNASNGSQGSSGTVTITWA